MVEFESVNRCHLDSWRVRVNPGWALFVLVTSSKWDLHSMTRKTRLALVFIPCLLLIASATPTFGQSWTSANGKHKIDAEFVQVEGDKVQLKKEKSGKLIWVELKKLSADDQKRARRLQDAADKKAAEANKPNKDDLLDQVELECTAELKESDFNGEKPQVVVSIVASGAPAAEAMRYGKVKLAKFTDGDGGKLAVEKDRFSMNDITKSLEKIERDSMFADHPDDGVGIELKLPAGVSPESIGDVSGTFSLLTGGERSVASVSSLSDYFGKTVKNDALKKAKLKIEIEKPSMENDTYSMSFNVSGNLKSLNRIWVGDADQEELKEQQGSSNSSFGKKASFSFFFQNDVSDIAVLHVETVKLKVPFEFSDIEVSGQ